MNDSEAMKILLIGHSDETEKLDSLLGTACGADVQVSTDPAKPCDIIVITDLESEDLTSLTEYLGTKQQCIRIAQSNMSEEGEKWNKIELHVDDFYSTPEKLVARIPFILKRLRLRESRMRQFSALFENAVDAIIIIDKRGVILRVNGSAKKIFQYEPKELLGKNVSLLMPESYARNHDDYISNYVKTGKRRVLGIGREVEGLRKNGEVFPVDLALSEFDSEGETFFTGIVRDITERRKLEHEILRISEHERRRVGQDLHDGLGQMLTGISLISKNLAKRLEDDSHPLAEEMLEVTELMRDADRMSRNISRGLVPVELDGAGISAALLSLTEKTSRIFNVKCTFSGVGEVTVRDSGAASNLYRIAQECISNAVKHGRASEIKIILKKAGDEIELSVADNGIGFPEELKKDRGMGVDIMKYRARVINARLEISQREEGGTTVRCVLSSPHA